MSFFYRIIDESIALTLWAFDGHWKRQESSFGVSCFAVVLDFVDCWFRWGKAHDEAAASREGKKCEFHLKTRK